MKLENLTKKELIKRNARLSIQLKDSTINTTKALDGWKGCINWIAKQNKIRRKRQINQDTTLAILWLVNGFVWLGFHGWKGIMPPLLIIGISCILRKMMEIGR